MNSSEFAAKVRAKYPGAYDSIDDATLTQKVLDKYPEYKDVVTTDEPTKLGSFARGAMSGIPGAETVISGIQALDPKTTYAQAHQTLENEKNQDWETNPVSYGAGKATGIVGTALALPATASLGGAAALGAGIGAASGLDAATAPSDMISSALKGAGTGAILGSAGHGIGKALEAAPDLAKRGLAALGKETSVNDIESYLANPSAINNAGTTQDVASTLANATNDVTKASGHLSENARGLLNPTENPLNIKDIKDAAMDSVGKYFTEGNPATASDDLATRTIVDQYQRLAQIAESNNGVVPETTLRAMIDRMQAATKDNTFGNPDASTSQQALKEFSGKLNDLLRGSNTPYAEAMAPSAEAAKLSSNLQDTFKLENGQPTDTTANKLSNLLKEGKPEEQSLADQLKNMTGTDIMGAMKNAKTNANFNAPGSGEAMKALMATMGFGMGKMTGVPYGGIAGAAAGRFAANAVNGGSIAKSLMNMYLSGSESFGNSALKPIMAKFGPVLINAAKAGGNQLAATHFVLATSNPEYQQLVDHAQTNMPEAQENTGVVNQE